MYYLGCRWSGCVWRLSVPVKLHARNKEKERKMRKNITLHKKLNYADESEFVLERRKSHHTCTHTHTHVHNTLINSIELSLFSGPKTTTST